MACSYNSGSIHTKKFSKSSGISRRVLQVSEPLKGGKPRDILFYVVEDLVRIVERFGRVLSIREQEQLCQDLLDKVREHNNKTLLVPPLEYDDMLRRIAQNRKTSLKA